MRVRPGILTCLSASMRTHSSTRSFFQAFDSLPISFGRQSFAQQNALRLSRKRITIGFLLIGLVVYQLRTATVETWLLSHVARRLSYKIASGSNSEVVFPGSDRPWLFSHPSFQNRLLAAVYENQELENPPARTAIQPYNRSVDKPQIGQLSRANF